MCQWFLRGSTSHVIIPCCVNWPRYLLFIYFYIITLKRAANFASIDYASFLSPSFFYFLRASTTLALFLLLLAMLLFVIRPGSSAIVTILIIACINHASSSFRDLSCNIIRAHCSDIIMLLLVVRINHASSIFCNWICYFCWLLNFCSTWAIFFLARSSGTIVVLTYFVHRSRELIKLNRAPNFRAYHAIMHYFAFELVTFTLITHTTFSIIFNEISRRSIELQIFILSLFFI